ncbi:MAG: class C sortase [Clostridiales Family XIII bacterium]|jgi:sortase A|nr:class C sortase [Clostridiales Family XIII bacterium]
MRSRVLFIAIIAVGALLVSWPFISNWQFTKQADELLAAYDSRVQAMPEQQRSDELERARAYNDNLSGLVVEDPFVAGSGIAYPTGYDNVLNTDGNGLMGHLEIPALSLSLPIYHGADDAVLEKGVGHIATTALPVGGAGTHCVLAAHRGLPGKELFTNVDKLVAGDVFLLRVLGETFAYRIDQISVVEPEALVDILPEPGADLCTLVTCTPLNINSHRLVIRGVRTEYIEGAPLPASPNNGARRALSAYEKQLLLALCIGVAAIAAALLVTRAALRRRQHP